MTGLPASRRVRVARWVARRVPVPRGAYLAALDRANFAEMEARRAHTAKADAERLLTDALRAHAGDKRRLTEAQTQVTLAEVAVETLTSELDTARTQTAYLALDQANRELRDAVEARAALAARLVVLEQRLVRIGQAASGDSNSDADEVLAVLELAAGVNDPTHGRIDIDIDVRLMEDL